MNCAVNNVIAPFKFVCLWICVQRKMYADTTPQTSRLFWTLIPLYIQIRLVSDVRNCNELKTEKSCIKTDAGRLWMYGINDSCMCMSLRQLVFVAQSVHYHPGVANIFEPLWPVINFFSCLNWRCGIYFLQWKNILLFKRRQLM